MCFPCVWLHDEDVRKRFLASSQACDSFVGRMLIGVLYTVFCFVGQGVDIDLSVTFSMAQKIPFSHFTFLDISLLLPFSLIYERPLQKTKFSCMMVWSWCYSVMYATPGELHVIWEGTKVTYVILSGLCVFPGFSRILWKMLNIVLLVDSWLVRTWKI